MVRTDFLEELLALENQNVIYELHNNEIVAMYTVAEVLAPQVVIEPSVKDGLIYQNGKFSQKDFDLIVKVSNNLQGDFDKNDLMWFLNSKEKERLRLSVKNLSIEPSDSVNFGSSGWWVWKEYQREISEDLNDIISVSETKEYKYKVNLENENALLGLKEYCINFYIALTYDIGVSKRESAGINVGNLDYQEKMTEERKKSSDSGQELMEASRELNGLKTAIQFTGDYFSHSQIDQINEFVNLWISELVLAKYVDKSSLREKVSDKIANEWLKKLGLNTSVLTIPGEIRATTFLETESKDGDKVFIQFDIDLLNFDFGNSGMPTMATGSGSVTVYDKSGKELDSSVIISAYADVCAFCEQLQEVAKSTIFSGLKEYFGIFGISADSTAEALSSQMMMKLLNSKYTKNVFQTVDARDMKSALKTITTKATDYGAKKIYKLLTTSIQKRTEVSIKCPVDVKVYDNDGNICGIINNNEVDLAYSDICITVVGEQKNVYLVGDDYTFELIGTDAGTMDYVVKEFDEDGNMMRKISYENIALADGCKYYSYVPEIENLSSVLFDLIDENGNSISPTIGADEEYEEKNIEIIANGICGEKLTWNLDKKGVLRIEGTGKMYDFENYYEPLTPTPWKEKASQIRYVLIGDGVTSIGNDSFYECGNLCHIYIPNSVTSIGSYAFAGCDSLDSIVIPESVSSLGRSAFSTGASSSSYDIIHRKLKRIIMRGNAPNVEDYAFYYIAAQLIIPENAKGYDKQPWTQMAICLGDRIYGKCGDNLTWELDKRGVLKIEGSGSMYSFYYTIGDSTSYAELPPWNVVSNQIKEIVIDAEAAQIGEGAFRSCKAVTNVTINQGVTSIGDSAFAYCSSLTSVTLPTSVTRIGSVAFCGCNSLEHISIPTSLTSIGNSAFSGCSSLKSISIPAGVAVMGGGAFYGCSGLESVSMPEKLPLVDFFGTFYGCSSLISIAIPEGVKGLTDAAFKDCTNLTSISIPESVTYIWSDVFDNCNPLLTIYCISGSYAETFAKENGFQYTYISDNSTHEHTWDSGRITKSATCIAKGIKTYTCTVCGKTKTEDIIVAGHKFGKWKTTKEATALAKGIRQRICTECGNIEKNDIAKLKAAAKVNVTSISLKIKQSTTKVKVTGLAKGDYIMSWKSDNTKIITVTAKGKITAKNKIGKTTVTVTLASGVKRQIKVTVQKSSVTTKKISGIPKTIILEKGKTKKLKPTISPITSTSKIMYTSSNKKVATVSSKGKIIAKKKGTAIITLKSGKKSVSCKVIVRE